MACEMSGWVQDIPVRVLMKWIRHSSRTGVLLLTDGEADGTIEFLGGAIVSARSDAHFDDIGTILLSNAVIDSDQLRQAAVRQQLAEEPAPLGRILVEMNCATKTDIRKAMRQQVDQCIEALLSMKEGCFEFHPALCGSDDITQNVSEVLREADVRRMFTP